MTDVLTFQTQSIFVASSTFEQVRSTSASASASTSTSTSTTVLMSEVVFVPLYYKLQLLD
jgi:hypothetical protein